MAEKNHLQERHYSKDFTVTKFNGQIAIGIYLLDFDHAGAKLETPFPLSPEYPVKFSFRVPPDEREFHVSGRVLSKQQLTIVPGKYHIRVQFYAPRWDLDKLCVETRYISKRLYP